jgi:hypothetical protein
MFRILFVLLLVSFEGFAAPGDRYFRNPRSGFDTNLCAYNGATDECLTIDQSTGSTINTDRGHTTTDALGADIEVLSGRTLFYPILDMTGGGGRTLTLNGTVFTRSITGGTITGTGTIEPF